MISQNRRMIRSKPDSHKLFTISGLLTVSGRTCTNSLILGRESTGPSLNREYIVKYTGFLRRTCGALCCLEVSFNYSKLPSAWIGFYEIRHKFWDTFVTVLKHLCNNIVNRIVTW